jgi:hypothetical protein
MLHICMILKHNKMILSQISIIFVSFKIIVKGKVFIRKIVSNKYGLLGRCT